MEGRTYRYYGQEAPLYPFGYGLSYTTFRYRDLVLSPLTLPICANLSVSVVVENTGQQDGEEVSTATPYRCGCSGYGYSQGLPWPGGSWTVPPALTPVPLGRWCSCTCGGSSRLCPCPAGSWWPSAAWPCRLARRPS